MLEKYFDSLLVRFVDKDSAPFNILSSVATQDIEGVELLTDRYGVSCHEKKIFRALVRICKTNYAP